MIFPSTRKRVYKQLVLPGYSLRFLSDLFLWSATAPETNICPESPILVESHQSRESDDSNCLTVTQIFLERKKKKAEIILNKD